MENGEDKRVEELRSLAEVEKEKKLYEKVMAKKTNNGERKLNMTATRSGDNVTIKFDLPIDLLRKWTGEDKDGRKA